MTKRTKTPWGRPIAAEVRTNPWNRPVTETRTNPWGRPLREVARNAWGRVTSDQPKQPAPKAIAPALGRVPDLTNPQPKAERSTAGVVRESRPQTMMIRESSRARIMRA